MSSRIISFVSSKIRIHSDLPTTRHILNNNIFPLGPNEISTWIQTDRPFYGFEEDGIYHISFKSKYSGKKGMAQSRVEIIYEENGKCRLEIKSGLNRRSFFTSYGILVGLMIFVISMSLKNQGMTVLSPATIITTMGFMLFILLFMILGGVVYHKKIIRVLKLLYKT